MSSTLKPIQDRLSLLESRISDLEKKGKELEKDLADPGILKDKSKIYKFLDEYGHVKKELEELMLKWEENQDRMDELMKEFGEQDLV